MSRYIDVVLNVPLNQAFTYREVPVNEGEEPLPSDSLFGLRVEVRFGNRKLTGIICKVHEAFPENCAVGEDKIRSASRYIDKNPIVTHELYELALWVSSYYISSVGEALFSMIPSGRRESDSFGFAFSEDEASFKRCTLSQEQEKAVRGILEESDSFFHYLYGKTGSGKTEVFLRCAEALLNQGKGVIYLVPEIGLTPQVVQAVVQRFGDTAAVLHSQLTPSQRLGEWKRILEKKARIVVGARSAVFAPIPDLGMIIIDEEHDGSYKAGNSPRYHARQVAMYRSSKLKIPLVMGSATPSVEAYKAMEDGSIKKHCLGERLAGGKMPEIKSINLSLKKSGSCLSGELSGEIKRTLEEKRQAILFLNRRGFTHFFRCSSCGFEMKCKNCSVSMTYHKSENRLRCHYCGYSIQPPTQCPKCGSLDVGYRGFGTEYIEAEVKAKFPNARLIRVDTDSVSHKGELQQKLADFRDGKYDLLLGTQMVAKGLNFPSLQLVGVVLADTALHMPDFRAAERTFSMITQVAGRAGRYFPDGKVLVQSYSPDMPPIALAVSGDSDEFYRMELEQRKLLGFPPFSRLLRLIFRSSKEDAAVKASESAFSILNACMEKDCSILGPCECPISMVAGNYRQQILLRGSKIAPLQKMASHLLRDFAAPSHVYIEVDVDPVSLL
ncbi:MAG: primosomal protein N' [Treponema sp.]|nr:primosomal protein N' [Treponema sp.]